MKNKIGKLKAFTLIEMLIVIVIIGILAAALIPKLNSARGRANDTARKADLSQTAAGIIAYQIDKGYLPSKCGSLLLLSGELLNAGLDEVPTDPVSFDIGGVGSAILNGDYGYCSITKNGQSDGGFALMSFAQSEGVANYVICTDEDTRTDRVVNGSAFKDIQNKKCTSFTQGACAQADGDGECTYTKGEGQLRYIYLQ